MEVTQIQGGNLMKNVFSYSFIVIIIITIIVAIFSSTVSFDYSDFGINPEDILVSENGFTWPLPNKYYISSYFGYRSLNLYGAASYHSGIDIPAIENTYFLATISRSCYLYWL